MDVNTTICYRGIRKLFRIFYYPYLRHLVNRDLKKIEFVSPTEYQESNDILYLRTNLWGRDSVASGAIAHTKGIVEAFVRAEKRVSICSPDKFDYLTEPVEYDVVDPNRMLSFGHNELAEMEYNQLLISTLLHRCKHSKPSFIYQRYGLNNYTGAYVANKLGVPFVLEYNGSEVWMSRYWGHALRYESIAQSIEFANFKAADLIVGNSETMIQELLSYGVPLDKICIIPNGVDPIRFNPQIEGSMVRSKLGFTSDDIVVTFIGTFGPWHGAEVLAQTVSKVCSVNSKARYLFIGDGIAYDKVSTMVEKSGFSDRVVMLGLVPQLEAASYLAASDILVSPQVPNPDGTPFFGSPTKLFEYMAMGKAIVASNLDQIGRILCHNKTALLTEPGNINDLAEAILCFSADLRLRERLGKQARKDVVAHYTWDRHIQLILEALKSKFVCSL